MVWPCEVIDAHGGGGVGALGGARLLLRFVLWLSRVRKAQVCVVNLLCLGVSAVCVYVCVSRLSAWIALCSHTAHIHRLFLK